MSTQQFIIDAATRHQVFLQRYAGGEAKKAVTALNRLRRDILGRLAQEPTIFQSQRLSAVLLDVESLIAESFALSSQSIKVGVKDLAVSEADFSVKLFNRGSTVEFALPSTEALIASVELAAMVPIGTGVASINLDDALRQFGGKKTQEILQTITDGVTLGDTTSVISRKVSSLMSAKQTRQLRALVHTATNHASSIARMATFKQNEKLLEGYEWVATLDGKTTLICMSRDGEVYQVGAGPMPPAHWNCRSTTIPKVKQQFSVGSKLTGKRAAVGAKGAETVGANKTYGGWLKTQPVEFIDEALGVKRSQLFRSGKLTIDKFVDPTGRVYTLPQLEGMHPFVFQEI